MKAVSIHRCGEYAQQMVDAIVARQFEELALSKCIRPGMRVAVKPNLLMKRAPDEFTTTHPNVVRAVVRSLKALGVEDIVLCDSPGGPYTGVTLGPIYRTTGMEQLAKEEGVALNLDTTSQVVPCENGALNQSFELISPIAGADAVINVAKLKTHAMTTLSGGVKNLFGCVPGLKKPEFHYRFPEKERFCSMLVDLCETVRPTVTFVDGIVAMEGNGPSGGSAYRAGLLLASEDVYSLDLALALLIGQKPEEVPIVKAAIDRGLCPSAFDKGRLVGEAEAFVPLQNFHGPDSKSLLFFATGPKFLTKWLQSFLTPRPVIRSKGCVGCGKCAESCPAHTIRVVAGKAHIDYSRCIRCYCCHEMCPVKTIEIKRNRLLR